MLLLVRSGGGSYSGTATVELQEDTQKIVLDHETTPAASASPGGQSTASETMEDRLVQPLYEVVQNDGLFGGQQQAAITEAFLVIVAHISSWLSEMLTFFLCIVFLKQWLQFDLFGGLPPGLSPGAANVEADAPYTNPNNNVMPGGQKKAIGVGANKRRFKRKNRSRSPSRSLARSVATTDEATSDISSICGDLSSCDTDDDLGEIDLENEQPPPAASSACGDLMGTDCEDDESWHSSGSATDKTGLDKAQQALEAARNLPLESLMARDLRELVHSDSEDSWRSSSLDSELSWFGQYYPKYRY